MSYGPLELKDVVRRKYLDGGDKKKKKREDQTNSTTSRFRIFDDDIDLNKIKSEKLSDEEEKLYATKEEKPQVAKVVDDRPFHLQGQSLWKAVGDVGTKVKSKKISKKREKEVVGNTDASNSIQRATNDSSQLSSDLTTRRRRDSDQSPPRRQQRGSGKSPPRRQRHDSDQSPPRRQQRGSEHSPPRRQRHDSDQSPPRRQQRCSEHSPPRRQQRGSEQSPPRRQRHDSDQSPPRRQQRFDRNKSPQRNNSDLRRSPVRRKRFESGSSQKVQSPSRSSSNTRRERSRSRSHPRRKFDTDMSPPRNRQNLSPGRAQADRDLSPPRKNGSKFGKGSDRDLSPPRRRLSPKSSPRRNPLESNTKISIKSERVDTNADLTSYDDLSGRYAKTVYRDRKTGKASNLEEEAAAKANEDKKISEKEAKYKEWSAGLKQRNDQQQKLQEDLHEMSKPLARSADDEDMDKMLREKEVEDDPMLEYMRKRRLNETQAEAVTLGEKVLEKPKYRGPPAPLNRFSIELGYRWDGVNRSNGFEKKFFERQADKLAVKEEAYKWSTQDM